MSDYLISDLVATIVWLILRVLFLVDCHFYEKQEKADNGKNAKNCVEEQ